MDLSIQLIFIGSLLVSLSIFAGLLSTRIGAPLLLTFLGVGMLFGEDGIGGIEFDDPETAYFVASLSLAVILFDGGLRTSMDVFRRSLWPAFFLSTAGVVITAIITAYFAVWFLNMSWAMGMLMGAILASTDAAAVFLLLHQKGTKLHKKITATLEMESGLNDPIAIFMTFTLVHIIKGDLDGGALAYTGRFFWEMGAATLLGLAGGKGLVFLVNRVPLRTGLYSVLVLAGGLFIFSGTILLHASGFLAVYLAGLIIGNNQLRKRELIIRFCDGMAWLAQIGMFIMIGLLVTPSSLLPLLAPATLIAMALIFVSRPAAVLACLAPFDYNWREKLFISWVGLRGAVPIFLALIPTLAGLDHGHIIFNVAFVVVTISLILQGWTVFLSARILKLEEVVPEPEPIPVPTLSSAH